MVMALATKRDIWESIDKHIEIYTSKNSIRVDRDRAETDVNYFFESVLNFEQWPIHKMIQGHIDAHRRAVIHIPTFFGKTTQVSYGRTMYELCRNQDANILVCSASFRRKLRPLLGQWKDTIHNNKKIQLLWPHMRIEDRPHRYTMDTQDGLIIQRSDKWFDETVKSEDFDLSNPSFQIGPTGGEFQGIRFNIGICDDMLPGDTAISAARRENDWHWYGQSFYSRRATDSWIWNIGTPHHKKDVYHKLITENGYAQLQVPDANGRMVNLNGLDYEKLWPERKKYVEDAKPGSSGGCMDFISFKRTIECQPISDALQYFMRDVLEGCYDDNAPWGLEHMKELGLSHLPNICGVDLASGKNKTKGKRTETSYTCMMPWDGGRMTIPYLKCTTMSTPEKILTAAHILENLPNTLFVVEDNGMQNDVVALYRSAEYIESCGVEHKLACELAGRVKTITTTGQNKHDPVSGVQGMDGYFRGKRLVLRRHVPEIERLFDGFESYTADDHTDDPVMSTWFAWHYWQTQTPAEYKADNMIGAPLGENGELHFGDGLTDYESECDPDTAGDWAGEMIYA
jgi:hypothetical protein